MANITLTKAKRVLITQKLVLSAKVVTLRRKRLIRSVDNLAVERVESSEMRASIDFAGHWGLVFLIMVFLERFSTIYGI